MSYYDEPPLRSYRGRRASFSTPPQYAQPQYAQPQYEDDYPRDYRSTGGKPRTYHASPGRDSDSYVHSPTRSYSPPGFYAERATGYTAYSRSREGSYDPYAPNSPPLHPHTRSRSRSRTHSHSQHQSKSKPQDPSHSSSSPLPHQPEVDVSPAAYTYSDEEPERIPIAPAAWNDHRTSASKEELITYFINRGFHPKVAATNVDREFSAYAPQYQAGVEGAMLSRAAQKSWSEDKHRARREKFRAEDSESSKPGPEQSRRYAAPPQAERARRREPPPATTTYRSPSPSYPYAPPPPWAQTERKARRREPPPAAYRSDPSSSSRPTPRHRSASSSSRYRAPSPPRSHWTHVVPPHTPDPEGVRRHRSRRGV